MSPARAEGGRRRTAARLAACAAAAAVLLAAWPGRAEALDFSKMLTLSPGAIVSALVIELVLSLMRGVLSPLIDVMFAWGTDFMTIPYVNRVILWLQALSVAAVVIVRIAMGIKEGLLLDGGAREVSLGEYVFKSIWAILLVALMPTVCRLVINLGLAMYNDLGGSGLVTQSLAWFDIGGDVELTDAIADVNLLWIVLGILSIMVLCACCGYQFVRRQVDMLVVCVIAPIVSVFSATENDSNQVADMLKSLFGLVSQQWIQIILVCVAIGFGQAFVAHSTVGSADGYLFGFSGEAGRAFLFCIASFAAGLTIPRLVDRYTFGAPGSHAGAIVASNVIGRGIRRIGR